MEKFAIIKLGGRQFLVKEGDKFVIERQVSLNPDVLLFSDGKTILVGSPLVESVKVKAEFVKGAKEYARKIRVGRFRNKSRYRKVKGHTQPISTVIISSITHGTEKKPVVKKTVTKKAAVKVSPKRKAVARATVRSK